MKKFAAGLLALAVLSVAAEWKVVEKNDSVTLSNHNENAEKNKTRRWLPLIGSGLVMQKVFDLTKLPAQWRENPGAAEIWFYCQIADQSEAVKKIARNGLTESFTITVNGKKFVVQTADTRIPKYRNWFKFAFPAELVTGDTLTVRVEKNTSKTNDDFFYMGVDTSSPLDASKISLNGGKRFIYEHQKLAGLKGEYMFRLVLYKERQELEADPGKGQTNPFELKDGAKIKNKTLLFDGLKSAAVLKNSEGFNVSEKGMTFAAVLKMNPNPENHPKKDHHMMIAFKKDAWFLGRTGNQFNLSFCTDKISWNNALFGGEYPELGEWMHVAVVFERVNESAQGNVGYLVKIYLNGEVITQKMFLYANPDTSDAPVILGNGLDGYGLQGEIAEARLFARSLTEGEIGELMKKSNRISKMPPGFYEVSPKLGSIMRHIASAVKTPEARFVGNALFRAAQTGYDQDVLSAFLKNNAEIFASNLTGRAFAEYWNKNISNFKIIPSDSGMLLVVNGKGKLNSPVLGLFNPVTGKDVFDSRSTSWTLSFDGRLVHDRHHAVEFETFNFQNNANGGKFQVKWVKAGDFETVSEFTLTGSRLEQTLNVKSLKNGSMLTEVVFPRYSLRKLPGKDDKAVFPLFSGVERKKPASNFSESGLYPTARSAMQFIGYYDELNNGVYAAFEAVDGALKTQYIIGKSNVLEYKWNNPVTMVKRNAGETLWQTSGPAVIQTYNGNWFEAGQLYKNFVETKAPWAVRELPRKDTAKWYLNNCIWWVMSANTAHGANYLREYFELPIALWFCHGTTTGKGDYPYYGFVEKAKNLGKIFPPEGIYLQLYLNGRLWGYNESVRYRKLRMKDKAALEGGVIERNGALYYENYGIQFPVMCTGSKLWQDHLIYMAGVASEAGYNGVYWDQLPCGSARLCWNKNHGHAPGDPTVWSRGYREILTRLREKFPHMAWDGEDNSEIYANTIDGFMTWRFVEPDHVPLFQSVYSGGRVQFTARAWDTFGYGRGDFEATFAKLGEQFVWGEQIGWMHIYDECFGTPRRMYAKKLGHLRLVMLDYLLAADMLKPLKFKKPVPRMTAVWGNTRKARISTDKVMSCAWKRLSDGKVALLFTNTTNETVTVAPTDRYAGLDKLTVCREGSENPEYIDLTKSPLPEVKLGAYASEIWIMGKEFDRAEGEKIAKVTKKVAGFVDGGESLPLGQPIFDKVYTTDASNGKWVPAKHASWMIFAFCEGNQTLGNEPGDKVSPEGFNWILMRNGGIACFGEVDFGSKAGKYAEIMYTAAPENAGGTLELCDITPDGTPNKVLASMKTASTGRYIAWKTVRIPIKGITGKRIIAARYNGKPIGLRAWRVVDGQAKLPAAFNSKKKVDFAAVRIVTPANGTWFNAKDAAWMIFAETNENSVKFSDGGYIGLGNVDFGEKAPEYLEVKVDDADGGILELCDINALGTPYTVLGAGKAVKGVVRIPLKKSFSGKRLTALRYYGKSCIINSWRVL